MTLGLLIVLLVIILSLVFVYVNGFHDTANSIATVVSTKVLTPRQAICLAAVTNLIGALWGTAVAKTIASGLVDTKVVTSEILICALIGAIIWNLVTWWFGLPSSSSHALVGGMCGAVLAGTHNEWNKIIWSEPSSQHWWLGNGVLWKVVMPMIISPIAGLFLGFVVMAILYYALKNKRPQAVNSVFGKLQLLSSASMGFMHGTNDAQKNMGIIALALLSGTAAGVFDGLPSCLEFLKTPAPLPGQSLEIALWIKLLCAVVISFGTAAGGWRIIKTLGHKMVKLQPIHGFAAETSSAFVIAVATHFGIPVSTTHNISASIMGVGAAKRFNAIKWPLVESMAWAWVMTMPVTALISYGCVYLMRYIGFMPM